MGKNMSEKEKIISGCFSNNVRKLMNANGIYSDSKLLEQVEISQSRFSNLMNKKTVPQVTELIEIADFFSVTVDSLISPDNESVSAKGWKNLTEYELTSNLIDLLENDMIYIVNGYGECGIAMSYRTKIIEGLLKWSSAKNDIEKLDISTQSEIMKMIKAGILSEMDKDITFGTWIEPFDVEPFNNNV